MRVVTRHGEYTLIQSAADRFRVERGARFCGVYAMARPVQSGCGIRDGATQGSSLGPATLQDAARPARPSARRVFMQG